MTVIERMARAMLAFVSNATEEEQMLPAIQFISNRDDLIARAALEALQEPSEAMASAGMHRLSEIPEDAGWIELLRAACDVYRAMIDAALNEVGS